MAVIVAVVVALSVVWQLGRFQPIDARPTKEVVWEHLERAYHNHEDLREGEKKVAKLGKPATPILLEVLEDSNQSRYWGRASVVLRLIGDEAAVEPLIALFENTEGDLDDERFAPMRGFHATMATIAAKGSDKALQYLIDNAKPEIWLNKKFKWTYLGFRGESPYLTRFREDNFVYREICALALTGHPRAVQALGEIRKYAGNEMWQLWASKAIEAAKEKSLESREAYLNQMWREEPLSPPWFWVVLVSVAAAVLFVWTGWWQLRRFRRRRDLPSQPSTN